MQKINNILIGADPELFLSKDNKVVSAVGIIGGSKNQPKLIDNSGNAVQEDNVMIEFNIKPSSTANEFIENINFVKEYLTTYVKLKNNYTLDYSSSAVFDKKELKSKQAKQFGCEPDFNVYEKDINIPPKASNTLRTCGGHIHVGYDNPSQEISEKIVYAMDITLGLDSIILDVDGHTRRKMYGRAGSFRFKDYGIEYRTLSNFWIKNNKSIKWAYDNTLKAIDLVNTDIINDILNNHEKDIQKVINTNDVEGSIELSLLINEIINKKVKV